ncbi:MAG: TlpA disulfide reductase family protein [Vicinamibacterales bacterium]
MRVNLRRAIGTVAMALLLAPVASAQDASGLWDAVIVANKVEVPFRFEVAVKGAAAEGFFFEGNTKVGSTAGSYQNGTLKLEYDFLNTVLEATFDGTQLKGTYKNNRPNARPQEFRAQRFKPVESSGPVPAKVDGSWAMYRSGENKFKLDVSWRLYLRESGGAISGAILRTSGDTGTLEGRWQNGTLVMSHFSGERPLLFEAKPNADGTLAVTLDRESNFIAARTSEIREKGIPEPPDLTRFTSVKDPTEKFHFSGLDVNGNPLSDADPRFQGKVVILSIGGTWCPNCHDEMPVMRELDAEFRAQGLEIVGLFFESDADLTVAKPRIGAFVRRHKVAFPIVVAGNRDEGPAKLSQLNNFAVFPTTVFIGRDGRVRSVHAGFASEATGEEHIRLKNEYRETVKRLLAEGGATASAR